MSETTIVEYEQKEYGSTNKKEEDNTDCPVKDMDEIYSEMGVGTAQILAWATVGLVSYLYYAELTVVSVIMPTLRCQWKLSSSFEECVVLAVFGSYAICGILFGKLGDIYGRRAVIIASTALILASGVGSASAPNKWVFLVFRMVEGGCIGTQRSSIACYAIEFSESRRRTIGITVNILATFTGMLLVNVVAWSCLEAVGWRWLIIIVVTPAVPALTLLIFLPESPYFLSSSGRREDAEAALRSLAKLNNVELHPRFQIPANIGVSKESRGSIHTVLSKPHRKSALTLSVMFSSNVFLDLGLIVFLPLLFSSSLCGAATTTAPPHNCHPLAKADFVKLIATSCGGIVGTILSLTAVNIIGRLISVRLAITIQTIALSLLFFCIDQRATFSIAVFIMSVESFVKTTIWIMIPESFPTSIRSTAAGLISGCGRIGGMMSTFCVYLLFYTCPTFLIALFFTTSLVGLVGAIVYNRETQDDTLT